MRPTSISARLVLTATICALSCPAVGLADDPMTWTFDEESSGADVYWTSPTALRADADLYVASWEITLLEVTVQWWIIPPFAIDVTGEIPEEYRIGSSWVPGPAPIVIFDDYVVFPEPPEPPGLQAHLLMGLDAAGYGYLAVTDVVLDTIVVDVPGFGLQEVDVQAIRFAGTLTAQAFDLLPGDMNCDGLVDFFDIDGFVQAVIEGGDGWPYPDCPWLNGDINGDWTVDFFDIDPFVALITG